MTHKNLFIKEAYYLGKEFKQETIKLKIPDILQFVQNIYYNFRIAEESRNIYNDICEQMLELRQNHKQYYDSFSYKVGNLDLDGRAYAQRNIRDWCAAMHRTLDSIFQIINIVYNVGNTVDSIGYSIVDKVKDDKLKKLIDNKEEIIKEVFLLDNYSKHILNIWGKEKFSPSVLQSVDYYIDTKNGRINVIDLMNENTEKRLKSAVIEILDYLIEKAKQQNYDNRKYVDLDYDPEIPYQYNAELSESLEISENDILKPTYTINIQDDETILVKDVMLEISSKPQKELYLMGLYRYTAPTGTTFIKVSSFASKSISVFKGETKIGTYHLQDNKQTTKYKNIIQTIHFSKYTLSDD